MLRSIIPEVLILTIAIFVIQVSTAGFAARYTGKFTWQESVMIGFGMLGRAELAFVVMDIAYVQSSILSAEAFFTLMLSISQNGETNEPASTQNKNRAYKGVDDLTFTILSFCEGDIGHLSRLLNDQISSSQTLSPIGERPIRAQNRQSLPNAYLVRDFHQMRLPDRRICYYCISRTKAGRLRKTQK